MAEFNISSQTMTSQTAVLRLSGAMDDIAFDLMEDQFNQMLDSGIVGLVMDLTGLETVTSASLGAIVNLAGVLKSRSGKLAVGGASPEVADTIALLGVGEQIGLENTVDAARKTVMAAIKP